MALGLVPFEGRVLEGGGLRLPETQTGMRVPWPVLRLIEGKSLDNPRTVAPPTFAALGIAPTGTLEGSPFTERSPCEVAAVAPAVIEIRPMQSTQPRATGAFLALFRLTVGAVARR
jgi:hypothetical protein